MKLAKCSTSIKMIPIEQINILNPRVRNQKIFHEIAGNIAKVGLKRPITVTAKSHAAGKSYDLVCGQGRLEAFQACGQSQIPAMVVDASEEQALIMSLIENLARRQHRPMDLLESIEILQKQGYKPNVIADKTGLTVEYIRVVLNLLERGEERLLTAVELGQIPLTIAVKIAESPGDEQRALQEAYETRQLRGNRLLMAKQLLEARKRRGKSLRDHTRTGPRNRQTTTISARDILKIYQKEVDRKRLLIRKAETANSRLLFIVEALRQLFGEENFTTLLRAEGLMTLPKQLAEMLEVKGAV